ncbi:MAG: hypothetical protein IQL11_07535, partial [Bacteroidales bacterium]|nr:hypothetical protein [Bacteroidales bacterium]
MKRLCALLAVSVITLSSYGQNSVPRTILPAKVVDELIGEASGERALNHIIEMAAYIHDRPASEYTDYFFETR